MPHQPKSPELAYARKNFRYKRATTAAAAAAVAAPAPAPALTPAPAPAAAPLRAPHQLKSPEQAYAYKNFLRHQKATAAAVVFFTPLFSLLAVELFLAFLYIKLSYIIGSLIFQNGRSS